MFITHPKKTITLFAILSLIGVVLAFQRIRFNFDLEHFFPTGDEDLAFFMSFREKFEPDDNFLLIGVHREEGVFEQQFMQRVLQTSLDMRRMELPTTTQDSGYLPHLKDKDGQTFLSPVVSSNCLLQLEYPVRNPITGFTMIPFVHLSAPEKYERDKNKILSDERLVNTFISADAKTLVIAVKTIDEIKQVDAKTFIEKTHEILARNDLDDYHLLGRTNFQTEIVKVQIREFILSTVVSILLVFLVLLLIFRKGWGIFVAMISILVGLLMFTGYLGATASTLDTMALLYPIIMIIVATSDVIHVMSKYIDELGKGHSKLDAIRTTIREIGLSILLTSTTTAVGFLSLYTSRLAPVKMFGVHAAVGVMIAYISVILFTTTILSLFQSGQITQKQKKGSFWERSMLWFYHVTKTHTNQILVGFAILFLVCGIGISMVTTNTLIEKMLPKDEKVTEDFLFFEQNFSGFRPLEIAISTKKGDDVDDFKIVTEIDKLEQHFRSYEPIRSVNSIATIYKSINQAYYPTREGSFAMPISQKRFKAYQKLMKRMDNSENLGLLISKDKKHTRISARIMDIGADSIKLLLQQSRQWINSNIDTSLIQSRATGTGVIIDKNSEYVRDSLLKGLFFAIVMISLFMALLYRNLKIIIIALIPNILPLIIAGALLGFLQIPLEAGVAIVFAIIFGIAVDDTIHLLSKFKLLKDRNYETDEAIKVTLLETGKAVCLTSVILFFGFLILLFSSSPPAVTIGLLISTTLFSALFCDLLIIPIMLRKWLP